jgi:hypothetical protein
MIATGHEYIHKGVRPRASKGIVGLVPRLGARVEVEVEGNR